MLATVSFIGRSNSGKTTLLEKVISELESRGFGVGVIKHSPHGFDIDHEGKDSWRFLEAGSKVVGVSSPNRVALIENVDKELDLTQLQTLFQGKVDILLTEGYKAINTPKIVVVTGEEDNRGGLTYEGETLAVVSPELSLLGIPKFSFAEINRIVNLLVNLMVYETRNHNRLERLIAESEALHGHERVICHQWGKGLMTIEKSG